MSKHCVIIGAGHGGVQLCASLRKDKWKGMITLIGNEPFLPYHRPPLSKTKLDPNDDPELKLLRTASFYESNDISLRMDTQVESIDPIKREIQLSGKTLAYDKLALCLGSTHRTPLIKGIDDPRVFTLKTAKDAVALRNRIPTSKRAVIIGAGFIGLEVAASLRNLGIEVSVIELAPRVLSRVTSPEVSAFFEQLHSQHGVQLISGVSITEISSSETELTVFGSDGLTLSCDFVVMGTGAVAHSALAEEAGLEVDNGIRVNAYNQTSDPDIYALGDCCSQFNERYGKYLRLESVQNAVDQAKTVSAALAGNPAKHTALPWFWSDQYDVKLQIAGISTGYDQLIIRGHPVPGECFSVWYLKGGKLLAVDAVNDAKAYAAGRKLLNTGIHPDSTVIADTSRDIKEILTTAQE